MDSLFLSVQDFFTTFLDSWVFFALKIFLIIYTTVIIVDVILLIYLGDPRAQMRQMRKGTSHIKTTKKHDMRTWTAIVDRLNTKDSDQYKAAVLEADRFTYKALGLQGYAGENFAERVAQIPQGSFSSLDALRDAHALSNKIVQNAHITLTSEQAKNILGVYEKFLKNIDYL